ncbi:MAG: GSCFA domain-containing protein [Clostridium sp.]|nr:GSCFA domain-containing protein [Clostridium sp.]
MQFRTEISVPARPGLVAHDSPIVMLGSCFTDNVGDLLDRDGFRVTHNPMGTLYNPVSILQAVRRALGDLRPYSAADVTLGPDGLFHCLDFSTRYISSDPDSLVDLLNSDITALGEKLRQAQTVIITLGTSYVYYKDGLSVGNCHKFPTQSFVRKRIEPEEAAYCIERMAGLLPWANIIFTISPIRHTADGLHGNQLGKAALLLGLDRAQARFEYFPSYEIMLDDLRDYRFYAADMKHPSDVAVEYIYEKFLQAYVSGPDQQKAADCRRLRKAAMHRPIRQ